MRSRVHVKSHPVHPILVSFPVAFIYGGLAADVAGRLGGWPSLGTTGAYLSLAAVATGLLAAVPGLIDYLSVVPPNSSARRRGAWHGAVNAAALALVAAGWFFRDGALTPGYATLALEAAGAVLVTVGGWLGGTLVYRNQIGVDHRYAHAGKWTEQVAEGTEGEAVVVARVDELKEGQMKLLHVNGRRIVLARTGAGHAALDDRCTHRGGPLSDGALVCGKVQCPWHGSQFDVRTGAVEAGPAEKPAATCRVEEQGGEVRLVVPPAKTE